MHIRALKEYICTQKAYLSSIDRVVLSDLIWVVGLEGYIVDFNHAFCSYFAKPPSDVSGKLLQDFLPICVARRFHKMERRVITSCSLKSNEERAIEVGDCYYNKLEA